MKTFREHLKEEVKIGALASGGIDIERDAVRDEINGILSAIAVKPCVTPYSSLNKIRKALAYFSIFLPKRVYLEGRHGVEVWEIKQFGDKMGFTDQGEWIHHVPAKYHLFFHYHRIGSMYYLEAKIVDEDELEKRISATEKMFAEETDAAARQDIAKHSAPKEKQHTALGDCDCSQGDSPSTKKAVSVSMKKKLDEKLTKGMSAGDVISDFVHSDDPKFKGKSKKERQKMALGAYYSMHPEKSKKVEEETYAMRQMKQKMGTLVNRSLGVERNVRTVMVKNKNDPSSKPHRIPKSKYDPSKYIMIQ